MMWDILSLLGLRTAGMAGVTEARAGKDIELFDNICTIKCYNNTRSYNYKVKLIDSTLMGLEPTTL